MRLVSNKKPHVLKLDLGWTRTDQFSSRHVAESEISVTIVWWCTQEGQIIIMSIIQQNYNSILYIYPVGDGRLWWEVGEVGVCPDLPLTDPTVPALSFVLSISNTLPPIEAVATAAVVNFFLSEIIIRNKYTDSRCQNMWWQIRSLWI